MPLPTRQGSKELDGGYPGTAAWRSQQAENRAEEAMEALLAALGQDVVELDNLQVQRTECKVADKWKVELCPFN